MPVKHSGIELRERKKENDRQHSHSQYERLGGVESVVILSLLQGEGANCVGP